MATTPSAFTLITTTEAQLLEKKITNLAGASSDHLGALNEVINEIGYMGGCAPYFLQGTLPPNIMAGRCDAIKPDMRTYERAYQCTLLRNTLSKIHVDLETLAAAPTTPFPLGKSPVHKALSEAYNLFDLDPKNTRAAYFRERLGEIASVLGLPQLAWTDPARQAPASSTTPKPSTSRPWS